MAEEKSNALQQREPAVAEGVERTRSGKVFSPPVDIWETDEAIVLAADMPGVDAESVEVSLEDGVLTIRGAVRPHGPEGADLAYAEYDPGDYVRRFSISEEIDQDRIEARIAGGVLRLTLPKAQPTRRKIEVKAE
ncbi:MAG: heat-shock protein Hsp20 [Planctomycetales bacterium 4484_123]|nr:MAG: heat-shock protein Hsp20 [Planctomycetales bacterium 4484_123]